MTLYCGIDLHSNNHYVCVIDDHDKRLFEKKFTNEAGPVIVALGKYKRRLKAVAIESTFNWYWLADALIGRASRWCWSIPRPWFSTKV